MRFSGRWFFSHWLIMGRSQNWPDLRSPIQKFRDMRMMHTNQYINLLKVSKLYLNHCRCGTTANFFGGGVTWPDLVTWPWKLGSQNFQGRCKNDVGTAMPNFAALRAAVFPLFRKNRTGGRKSPPPPGVRGLRYIPRVTLLHLPLLWF